MSRLRPGFPWFRLAPVWPTNLVTGVASSTDNAVARWDGTSGTIIQNSVVTIADTSGNMAGVGTLNTHTIPGGTDTFVLLDATQILTAKTIGVASMGTGVASFTAYAVICGGTTSTNPLQSIAGVGTSGQVLTSNGAGALPTFQPAAGGGANEFTHVLTVRDAVLPTTNFPSLDKIGTTFVYEVLGFDTTTSEAAFWYIAIPPSVTPSTHKITITWTNASGLTTETVQWDIDWRSVSDDEVVDAATTPTTVNDTVSDTWIAQGDVHTVTLTLSSATNVVAGDLLEIKISRDVANDNLTGDARFISAVYEITS